MSNYLGQSQGAMSTINFNTNPGSPTGGSFTGVSRVDGGTLVDSAPLRRG